jgi:hypothetical protein
MKNLFNLIYEKSIAGYPYNLDFDIGLTYTLESQLYVNQV